VFLRDTLLGVLKDQRQPVAQEPEISRTLASRLPPPSPLHTLVLTGVRRSGKSILQAQLIRANPGAFYLNIEDTRLFGLGPPDFPTLLDVIEELATGKTIFLDEIQELPEWQRLVRSLIDRGHAVCVTGSNASLLGRELGAKLTGRHRSFEVFPFSYSEYLAYTAGQKGPDTLGGYLDHGGFPGYLHERDPHVLQELLRDIVQRDIAQRHHLREARHVMNLALFLLANTGQPLSLQGLTKALAIPTVGQTSRYVEFLQDAYLLFAVPKFSTSFKQRVVAPNKYYAIDNGLRRVNSPNFTPDVGHRLENAVFLSLRQRGLKPCYAGEKDRWECDFVTDELAIQVCAQLTPFNREREFEGLRRACALPGKRRGLVVTMDQKDALNMDGMTVEVVPASTWMEV
jgi:predicted AAA+ superfamily ATPase